MIVERRRAYKAEGDGLSDRSKQAVKNYETIAGLWPMAGSIWPVDMSRYVPAPSKCASISSSVFPFVSGRKTAAVMK